MFGLLSSLFGCSQKQKTELVLIQENHDQYYKIGTELIDPYVILSDNSSILDKKAKDNIREGIRYLEAVTEINKNNFAAFWIKGKGYQALREHASAYNEFKKSFHLNQNNPDVARELSLECLDLGKTKEAVEISLHALKLDSTSSGLIANLALSYLFNSDLDLSSKTISKAISVDPADKINYDIKKIIDDVISGKRIQPKKYDDLNK